MNLLLILSIVFATAFSRPNSRILGGKNATTGEIPYQVSFQNVYFSVFSHICGGAIISPTWVITAANCITDTPPFPAPGTQRIVAGIANLANDIGQAINIVKIVVNSKYVVSPGPNDVALLQLETPLLFNANVQPIALPKAGAAETGSAVLSGWGAVGEINGINDYPDVLQIVEVPLIGPADCKADLDQLLDGEENPLDVVSNICAGPLTGKNSACEGDNGSPLTQDHALVGIVSWELPCGTVGAPTVLTHVASFLDFIKSNVDDL